MKEQPSPSESNPPNFCPIDIDELVTQNNYKQALKTALLHRRVSMVGCNQLLYRYRKGRRYKVGIKDISEFDIKGVQNVCLCCGRFPREVLRVDFDIHETGFLGPGYPLYFCMQQMCMMLLAILYTLVSINGQIYQHIGKHWFSKKKILARFIDEEDLLCINMCIAGLLCIWFYSTYMVDLILIADERDTSPEDYSVLVKNIPQVQTNMSESLTQIQGSNSTQTQLKAFFETYFSKKLVVQEISMCYNLAPLMNLQTRKKELIEKYKAYQIKRQFKKAMISKLFQDSTLPFQVVQYKGVTPDTEAKQPMLLKNIEDICRQKIGYVSTRIKYGYRNSELLFLGQAFISFESQKMAEYLLSGKAQAYFYGHQLKFYKPEHPKGIYWYNLHLNDKDYSLRRMFSFIVLISVFLSSLFIQIGLNYVRVKIQGTAYESQFFKYFTDITINLINIMIGMFLLRFLSSYEGHRSRTGEMLSYATKSIFLQVANTLITPLLVAYLLKQYHEKQSLLSKQNGVLFRNSFFSVLIVLSSKNYYIKQLVIMAFERGYSIIGLVPQVITVKQLCEMYEFPAFQIEIRSSDIIKTMLLTFFWGFEQPRVILYALIGFYFLYRIDKYILTRRSIVRYHVNPDMNTRLSAILHLALPLFLAKSLFRHSVSTIKILLFIISSVFYFKPLVSFAQNASNRQKDEIGKNIKFSECKKRLFETDYRRQNPALGGVAPEEEVSRLVEDQPMGPASSILESKKFR